MIRLAILDEAVEQVVQHLESRSPAEEGCFCLLWQGKGRQGIRLLASRPFLSDQRSWERQGTDVLRPSAQWVSAAVSRAIEADSGLLFIHSHPNSLHPPGLSGADLFAFDALARTLAPMLNGPFGSVVVHPTGWSGMVWADTGPLSIDRIISVGKTIRFLSPIPLNNDTDLDCRQRDALGVVHDRLQSLTVAVVGCGGLGSPIAEQLVRMGVAEVLLIDRDILDTPSNVRRMFGSTVHDLRPDHPKTKVDILADHLEGLGFDVAVRRVAADVCTEAAFRRLLDSDVVMLATDNHGSRAVVNELAAVYLLPVVDVGVRVGAKSETGLSGLLAEVRVLTPVTPCLWCRRTINADTIRAENLPSEERERLTQEGYVVNGVDDPVPSVAALTVLASGMATCALLALLSQEGQVTPSGYWFDGLLGDALRTLPEEPVPNCRCRQNIGHGDNASPPFVAEPSLSG